MFWVVRSPMAFCGLKQYLSGKKYWGMSIKRNKHLKNFASLGNFRWVMKRNILTWRICKVKTKIKLWVCLWVGVLQPPPSKCCMLDFSYWNCVFYLLFMAFFIKGSWYSQKNFGTIQNFSQLISNACSKTPALPLGLWGCPGSLVTDLFFKVVWHTSTPAASKKFQLSVSWERSTSHADIQRQP